MVKYRYVANRFVGYLRAPFRRFVDSPTPPRSPYAGPVPLALRVTSAGGQPYPRAALALSSPFARRLDCPRASPPTRPYHPRRFSGSSAEFPRPLSPEDDQRLQEELRLTDSLYSNALRLARVTGIRIGECIHLPIDCQRHLGPEQWALHVPLGKLHTERLVPLDSEGLRLLARILELRAQASPARLRKSEGFLLPRVGGRFALFQTLRVALADFAKRARCTDTSPISPHRLRHTWASDTLRRGVSLPALTELMGHKHI